MMKRADLHANTTYALRRSDDLVVPARLLDPDNLWTPMRSSEGLFLVDSRSHNPRMRGADQPVGLLVASLLAPRADAEQRLHLFPERVLRRAADWMGRLPDLRATQRSPEGLAEWMDRVSWHHADLFAVQLEVVPNARLLAPWGTPLVTCPECGRGGFRVDAEGRMQDHDFRPPVRVLCGVSGRVLLGGQVGV